MNSTKINQWLTLGANIGVLIGLILLVVEINQNQDFARAETRNEVFRGLADILPNLAEAAPALAKLKEGEPLSTEEAITANAWAEVAIRYWENATYQYQIGLYDESEFSAHRNTIKAGFTTIFPELTVPHYCNNHDGFTESFRAIVDEYVTPEMCETYANPML